MSKIILLILFSSFLLSDSKNAGEKISKVKIDKKKEFKIKNPKAQAEFNRLKTEFLENKELLNSSYEKKIRVLKKERKEEMKGLRAEYKKKLEELKRKYPQMPDLKLDSKPKPRIEPPRDSSEKKDESVRKKKRKNKSSDKPTLDAKPPRKK
tara:strand:- start:1158 stop:1613 length:456 start_codon:yes stop_codon:yes gene_type:complete